MKRWTLFKSPFQTVDKTVFGNMFQELFCISYVNMYYIVWHKNNFEPYYALLSSSNWQASLDSCSKIRGLAPFLFF